MNQEHAGKPRKRPKEDTDRGIQCSRCGCCHVPVLYTRSRPGQILRIRECRHCRKRMTTRERPD